MPKDSARSLALAEDRCRFRSLGANVSKFRARTGAIVRYEPLRPKSVYTMAFAHPRPADLSRSRSPQDDAHDVSSKRQRTRSRSPDHHRRRHHHHAHHHSKKADVSSPVVLPFSARSLSKHDLEVFRGLFALYLDIQKGLVLDELEGGEEEIRGRWKSFVKKW